MLQPGPDDLDILSYTSGTTGLPKGAMNTQRNLVVDAQVYRDWVGLGDDDVVLGVAPLFHITGLVAHIGIAQLIGAPLVLVHRFDPNSGAVSVAVPVPDTVVRVIRDGGSEADSGRYGELLTSGPQVVPAYWNKPEATKRGIPGGELHTGDIGFMDEDGWFYVVDRKKDMINASGYKVWPREVEDVLYGHPDVLEAAVVGVPDEYRGETVKAVVSLQPGSTATSDEIRAYAKANLAAYKYPRIVEIMEELPKTPTGKILRRKLR